MEAIVILGPESSGTKMLARAFVELGYFGDYEYAQRMDDLNFKKAGGQKLVFRRSYPHFRIWPDFTWIHKKLTDAGYTDIKPIVIVRDKDFTALSQVANNHIDTDANAKAQIETALPLIMKQILSVGMNPTIVLYEPFVKLPEYREAFFKQFDLTVPDNVPFFNGNEKYAEVYQNKNEDFTRKHLEISKGAIAYCICTRPTSFAGWLFKGWRVDRIVPDETTAKSCLKAINETDLAKYIKVIKMELPIPLNFHFIPKKAVVL